ncbi:MAG: type VI secretion system tip protein TssI/VgrG [Polyangiaceae bacterium]
MTQSNPGGFAFGVFNLRVGAIAPEQVHVVSFRGVERQNHPYEFEVRVRLSRDVALSHLDRTLLGAPAHLEIPGPEVARHVRGIVTRIRSLPPDSTPGALFDLTIGPRLARLAHRRGKRIFQEMPVVGIVQAILLPSRVLSLVEVVRLAPQRVYCVQYDESELEFIERLLAEEGCCYFFTHPGEDDAPEVMVIADNPLAYRDVPGLTIPWVEVAGLAAPGDHIQHLAAVRQLRPGSVTIREFDFTRPMHHPTAVMAATPVGPSGLELDIADLEVYEHYDELECADIGQEAALLHLQALRRDALVFEGTGTSRRVAPGARFKIDWPLAHEFGDTFIVTSVEHQGRASDEGNTTLHETVYQNRFTCVPDGVVDRPPRPARRHQQVLETATVVGPANEDVYVDELGRVKVQFHWDREGRRNEYSSSWIRVSQAWAGTGWGFQFIPRVGMEVLVSFITGDTDKPIITGAVYNTANPEPYTLPRDKAMSGIKTRSIGSGAEGELGLGFNELRFEDVAGSERVYLHAERDLDEHVKHNLSTFVAGESLTTVYGDMTTNCGGRYFTIAETELSLMSGQDLSFNAGRDHRRDVGGAEVITVSGARADTVAGSSNVNIGGAFTLHVGEAQFASVRGPAVLAYGDSVTTIVTDATTHQTSKAEVSVITSCNLTADTLTVTAGRIVLAVGSTKLELTDDTISLSADNIRVHGADSLHGTTDGASLEMSTSAVNVIGPDVALESGGAAVRLSGNATIEASAIQLQSGSGSSTSRSASESASTTSELLHFTIYVGAGNEESTHGYLALLNVAGGELRRFSASAAVSRTNGFLVFEVDPTTVDEPVEVVWIEHRYMHHVAGPAELRRLRDAILDDRPQVAARVRRHRPRVRRSVDPAPMEGGVCEDEPTTESPEPTPAPGPTSDGDVGTAADDEVQVGASTVMREEQITLDRLVRVMPATSRAFRRRRRQRANPGGQGSEGGGQS